MTDDINDVRHTSTLAKFEESVRRSSPASATLADDLTKLLSIMKGAQGRSDSMMRVWDHDITAVELAIAALRASQPATPTGGEDIRGRARKAADAKNFYDPREAQDFEDDLVRKATSQSSAGTESGAVTPSKEAMMAAVEMEILSSLGRVHTVKIGDLIQKIIDARTPTAAQPTWQPIETAPERGDAAMLLYFPPVVVGAHQQNTLPAMYRTGHPDEYPNRKPSHFMLLVAPAISSTEGKCRGEG